MFDPYTQMNPWTSGVYGSVPPYGVNPQTFFPVQQGFGYGSPSPFFGYPVAQLAPQAWYGNPVATLNPLTNPIAQQAVQQIPHLLQNANQIAQQVPQLIQQIPQIIQQNPQLAQQAPQLQQIPQVLQQAAVLAHQVPQVLQALCTSPQLQGGAFGTNPWAGNVGFRPFA